MDSCVHAARGFDDRPPQVAARYLPVVMVAVALAVTVGCQRGVPAVDTDPQPPQPAATISGTVRGPEGGLSADSRVVDVVNVDTGETRRVTTNQTGEFSCKLRPGKYRVALTLRAGESLVHEPGIIDLDRADRAIHADFVLGTSRVSRPRGPVYRTDDGLGSPIA
jgi:hypothetical protein